MGSVIISLPRGWDYVDIQTGTLEEMYKTPYTFTLRQIQMCRSCVHLKNIPADKDDVFLSVGMFSHFSLIA